MLSQTSDSLCHNNHYLILHEINTKSGSLSPQLTRRPPLPPCRTPARPLRAPRNSTLAQSEPNVSEIIASCDGIAACTVTCVFRAMCKTAHTNAHCRTASVLAQYDRATHFKLQHLPVVFCVFMTTESSHPSHPPNSTLTQVPTTRLR